MLTGRASPRFTWTSILTWVLMPQRFGLWLRRAIFDHLDFAAVHLLEPGDDPAEAAASYTAKLNAAPIDIVCCGIGTNGHLAFNDPPADFDDPFTVKVVLLDAQCRQQQVDDGCFATLSEVPTRALTVTLPALLEARAIFCTVPGSSKRLAVRRVVNDPIGPPRVLPPPCDGIHVVLSISIPTLPVIYFRKFH